VAYAVEINKNRDDAPVIADLWRFEKKSERRSRASPRRTGGRRPRAKRDETSQNAPKVGREEIFAMSLLAAIFRTSF
jgi:hypothetical protein